MTSLQFTTRYGNAFFLPNTEDEKVQMRLMQALNQEQFEELFRHKAPADWGNMTADDVEEMLAEAGYTFNALIKACVEAICEHVTAWTYGWDSNKHIEDGTVFYVENKTSSSLNDPLRIEPLNENELTEMNKLQGILGIKVPIEGKIWSVVETQ